MYFYYPVHKDRGKGKQDREGGDQDFVMYPK